jgi:spermidine synthase
VFMIPRIFVTAKIKMLVLTSMVFLGALLLFGMEPLIGRLLAPFLGGAAHVWLICLMFFQAMLFFGYLYSHLFARKIGLWHLLLLLLPLVVLPFDIQPPAGIESPVIQILVVLILHAALPFVVLSTTAIIAQVWLSGSSLAKIYDPYPLYGASNAGSFAALFGYSFLVEPLIGLRIQSLSWTALYLVYMGVACASWFLLFRGKETGTQASELNVQTPCAPVSHSLYLKWILLSCLPSALLLAVTNLIILEIGSFPLTWIFPLALYLLSFIVTFRARGGMPGYLRRLWPEILMVALMLYLFGQAHWFISITTLILFFLICLVSHGTLYETRPATDHLTHFYLAIAFGGWLGGAAVSLAAPKFFSGLYEYPILLVLLAAAFFLFRHRSIREILPDFSLFGFLRVVLIVLVVTQVGRVLHHSQDERTQHRNFYGTYRVVDDKPAMVASSGVRKLMHGATLHGAQSLDGSERANPLAYYYRGGAIAQAFAAVTAPRNIAVVGLGTGAMAAHAGELDSITFYEIDPDIEPVARKWFTYLGDGKAKKEVIVGDGRLALQKDLSNRPKYDLILIDAFTGDGIPVHLLTREAIEIYLTRLTADGLLIFHVSNRYYELRPVIKAIARDLNLHGATNISLPKDQLRPEQLDTLCVVLTGNRESLQPLVETGWVLFGEDGMKEMAPWTDDYINILEPLQEGVKTRYRAWKIELPF